jgi:hypothetical protein
MYGNPSQDTSPKSTHGRAFHLPIDPNVFMQEGNIYGFLDDLDDQELLGNNEPFNSLGFTTELVNHQVIGYSMETKATVEDVERMQPYLGYRPLHVI